jgi:maleate isomerase
MGRASDELIAVCVNFRSHLVIDALKARIGKPVVTSTQAVLWRLFRLAGINTPIHGFGLLCERISTRGAEDRSGENDPTAR